MTFPIKGLTQLLNNGRVVILKKRFTKYSAQLFYDFPQLFKNATYEYI